MAWAHWGCEWVVSDPGPTRSPDPLTTPDPLTLQTHAQSQSPLTAQTHTQPGPTHSWSQLTAQTHSQPQTHSRCRPTHNPRPAHSPHPLSSQTHSQPGPTHNPRPTLSPDPFLTPSPSIPAPARPRSRSCRHARAPSRRAGPSCGDAVWGERPSPRFTPSPSLGRGSGWSHQPWSRAPCWGATLGDGPAGSLGAWGTRWSITHGIKAHVRSGPAELPRMRSSVRSPKRSRFPQNPMDKAVLGGRGSTGGKDRGLRNGAGPTPSSPSHAGWPQGSRPTSPALPGATVPAWALWEVWGRSGRTQPSRWPSPAPCVLSSERNPWWHRDVRVSTGRGRGHSLREPMGRGLTRLGGDMLVWEC